MLDRPTSTGFNGGRVWTWRKQPRRCGAFVFPAWATDPFPGLVKGDFIMRHSCATNLGPRSTEKLPRRRPSPFLHRLVFIFKLVLFALQRVNRRRCRIPSPASDTGRCFSTVTFPFWKTPVFLEKRTRRRKTSALPRRYSGLALLLAATLQAHDRVRRTLMETGPFGDPPPTHPRPVALACVIPA